MTMQWGDSRLPDKFWERVVPEPMNGCWLWVGGQTSAGYGTYKSSTSHRTLFAALNPGTDMAGLDVDHICMVRCCANPQHLRLVTRAENLRCSNSVSAVNARATQCPSGHEYNYENTYRNPRNGDRQCRTCRAIHDKSRQERRRCRTGNP